MKELGSFILKESRHILRDKRALLILFVMPIVLVILFGFAITNDVKDAKIAILDNSHDELSINLTNKLLSSGYFQQNIAIESNEQLEEVFQTGAVKMAVIFPQGFDRSFYHDGNVTIQIIADASDLNMATTLTNYASSIIRDYQNELQSETGANQMFDVTLKSLYNPEQKGVFMFVPGVLALILIIISALMTAVSIAREKETGTLRVITVSPLHPYTIILGKVIPYLIISILDAILILTLSVVIFEMPINGSIWLLALVCILYVFTALSIGIMISTFAKTQQVALIFSIMALFLPTVLLSGFIYPIENMHIILQMLSKIFPAKWFIEAIKSVMIKGTGIQDIWLQITVMLTQIIVMLRISIVKIRDIN